MSNDYQISRTDPANGYFIIKPYTVNGPASPVSNALYPGAISANTPLVLLGKGEVNYGQPVAQDMVNMLENFAGPTAPFYAIQGQLWYDNVNTTLSVYSGSNWHAVPASGLMTSTFDVSGQRLTNLANATDATDAVNRQTGDLRYLQVSGGTVPGIINATGGITGLPAPTVSSAAATKSYVDTSITAVTSNAVLSFNTRVGAITLSNIDISTALGFTPYSAANPSGYVTSLTAPVRSINGYTGAITLVSADVVTMLGYTPYDGATNLNGYVSATTAPVRSVNGHTGDVVLNTTDISTILGYVPYNGATNPNGYVTAASIGGVNTFNGRSGTVVLTTADVTTALTYTPYNGATNPNGYISAGSAPVTSVNGYTGAVSLVASDIISSLGYTPIPQGSASNVIGGYMTPSTSTLNLTLSVGGPVAISGVAAAYHTQGLSTITANANPGGNISSRMRTTLLSASSFPSTTAGAVISQYDQDLARLMAAKSRTLFTITGYAITAVTTGVSGTFTVAGDQRSLFVAGFTFIVYGNGGATANTTYTVASSTFGANTVVTVSGTVDATTTVSGSIRPLTYQLSTAANYGVEHNTLRVYGNGLKLIANDRGRSRISMTGKWSGGWCGLVNGTYTFSVAVNGGGSTGVSLTLSRPSFTMAAGIVPGAAGAAAWAVSGDVTTSVNIDQQLIVLGNTGLGTNATFTGSISGTTLTVSAVSSGVLTIGCTVLSVGTSQPTVITSQLTGTTGSTGTYALSALSQTVTSQTMRTAPLYTVSSVVYNGTNTIISVYEPIAATATITGTIQPTTLFEHLTTSINAALTTAGVAATYSDWYDWVGFTSNTAGQGSQITVTDTNMLSTIGTNLAITPTITNAPAVASNYAYTEVGTPFAMSTLIKFDQTNVAVGTVIEAIYSI